MTEIEIGQYWALPALDQIPPLLVGIFSLEEFEGHGRVAGVLVQPHPTAQKAGWPQVSHLPIIADALGVQTGRIVRANVLTPHQFTVGYDLWHQKFEMGEAGVFSNSVSTVYATAVNIAGERSTEND